MLKRKITALALTFTVACACMLAGCGADSSQENGGQASAQTPSDQQQSAFMYSEGTDDDSVTYELNMTYANSKYVETGDETLPRVNRDGRAEVVVAKADNDDTRQTMIYGVLTALTLLADDPAQHGGGADDETYVTDAFGIGDITIEDGICTIDLTGDAVMEQNMYTERFFIIQTVDTILNSFDEITGVAFTVNGEHTDALSYMSIDSPFTAADIESMING